MTTRRLVSRAFVAAAAALSLAACADGTAPSAPVLSPESARVASPSFDIAGTSVTITMVGDTATARFVVQPSGSQTFVVAGKHAIKFPAGAICDLATTAYGPAEWDKPCAPSAAPVAVSLKAYRNALGQTKVDFFPAMRFNPATSGVFLYLEDNTSTVSPWFKQINYCTDAGACYDESRTDASLTTFYNASTKLHARRLKHFSGYMVGVGRSEEGF